MRSSADANADIFADAASRLKLGLRNCGGAATLLQSGKTSRSGWCRCEDEATAHAYAVPPRRLSPPVGAEASLKRRRQRRSDGSSLQTRRNAASGLLDRSVGESGSCIVPNECQGRRHWHQASRGGGHWRAAGAPPRCGLRRARGADARFCVLGSRGLHHAAKRRARRRRQRAAVPPRRCVKWRTAAGRCRAAACGGGSVPGEGDGGRSAGRTAGRSHVEGGPSAGRATSAAAWRRKRASERPLPAAGQRR